MGWRRLDDYVVALELNATWNQGNYHVFLTTTWEIWEAICQTYFKMRDAALIYVMKPRPRFHRLNMLHIQSQDTIILLLKFGIQS